MSAASAAAANLGDLYWLIFWCVIAICITVVLVVAIIHDHDCEEGE